MVSYMACFNSQIEEFDVYTKLAEADSVFCDNSVVTDVKEVDCEWYSSSLRESDNTMSAQDLHSESVENIFLFAGLITTNSFHKSLLNVLYLN
jgi:hypothetical protein